MRINYFLRRPAFPVIGSVDGYIFTASSDPELRRQIGRFGLKPKGRYDVIDFASKGWELTGQLDLIPTEIVPNRNYRWPKLDLVRLYNTSEGTKEMYSEKSLSAKRYEKVFLDLVGLISQIKK